MGSDQVDVICRAVVAAIMDEDAITAEGVTAVARKLNVPIDVLVAAFEEARLANGIGDTQRQLAEMLKRLSGSGSSVAINNAIHVITIDECRGLIVDGELIMKSEPASIDGFALLKAGHSLSRALKRPLKMLSLDAWDNWSWAEVVESVRNPNLKQTSATVKH